MTSTTSHKRTKSHRTLPSTLTPSPLSLYLTTLRLLDIHTSPSAPQLSNTAFTTDSRSRLRATEFSLYHLFRLYSPSLTAEKLTPFFPPLEPLQSVNLRAALFRCLEGLRKDGVLGPGLVLRKSMLEECAGERWWEVCCAFGGVVLGKVTRDRRQGKCIDMIGKMGAEEKQVMALAMGVGLGGVVRQRRNMRQTYGETSEVLSSKEEDLQVRGLTVRERGRKPRDAKQEGRLRSLDEHLTRSWIGDEDLKRVLLDCGGHDAEDAVFLQTTTDFMTGNGATQREDQRIAVGNLEQRAKAQSTRMQQWQKIHSKLQSSTEFEKPAQADTTALISNTLRFDRHRDLSPTAMTHQSHHSSAVPRTGPHLATYDQLLTTMREELRRGRRAATAPEPQRRPKSITLDTLAGAPNLQPASSSAVPFSPQRSPSGGFRPGMHGRMPSRTRTYQAPRVVSQKGLVPLKSEIFSPLKSDRPGSWDRSSRTVSVTMGSRKQSEDSGESGSIGEATKVDSTVGGLTGSEELASPDELDETATDDSHDSLRPTSPPTVPLSLAERTRKSMAAVPSPSPPSQAPALPPPAPQLDEPTDSLAARTLQTLSSHALPPPQQRASKANGHARTRSSIHSTSLHPQKVRRSSFTALQPTTEANGDVEHAAADTESSNSLQVSGDSVVKSKRDITPREALFEATAGYDSVFRPRPKVKYSPPSSPTREGPSSVGNGV
ncbi:hypothetical protein B0A48_12095 [Cryoendolithus antarcticus]|uniref:HAUS augmin-like complex subunit 6 N-terminal domain-containing protein n=1 Tax=Cryoendolithus antarcticus TaxID=1507870 RepID=A0A1V8STP8_9PEZI|nr:hypothetical protein B0A48_12095 [Cryoendolithus antarcticus]